jgi:tripartite-type tricarboxylate transporter receptor subunit TctC
MGMPVLAENRAGANGMIGTDLVAKSALAAELLALMSGTRLTHVPYKGSAAALADFEITQWQGFFVPRGTDGAMVARLDQEVVKVLKLPDVIERLQGANDLARYSRLIHDAGIRAE